MLYIPYQNPYNRHSKSSHKTIKLRKSNDYKNPHQFFNKISSNKSTITSTVTSTSSFNLHKNQIFHVIFLNDDRNSIDSQRIFFMALEVSGKRRYFIESNEMERTASVGKKVIFDVLIKGFFVKNLYLSCNIILCTFWLVETNINVIFWKGLKNKFVWLLNYTLKYVKTWWKNSQILRFFCEILFKIIFSVSFRKKIETLMSKYLLLQKNPTWIINLIHKMIKL